MNMCMNLTPYEPNTVCMNLTPYNTLQERSKSQALYSVHTHCIRYMHMYTAQRIEEKKEGKNGDEFIVLHLPFPSLPPSLPSSLLPSPAVGTDTLPALQRYVLSHNVLYQEVCGDKGMV